MSGRAAMSGQIVRIRDVGAHKSLEVTVHIPTEQRLDFISVFGWPTMVDPVPIAFARLNFTPQPTKEEPTQERHTPEVPASADTRSARVNRLTQQAAIWCGEPRAWTFINEYFLDNRYGFKVETRDHANDWLKAHLGVQRKRDILPGTEAAQKLEKLLGHYNGWLIA